MIKKRIAIYARFSSSDLQSDSSVEDQLRLAMQRAEREGWEVVDTYCDHGISGASMQRPELQRLMQDAAAGKFDMVLVEGLDRISRDQEHTAGIYKRLTFARVQIFSLVEGGIINDMHVGFNGTMNARTLIDLRYKTKRGISGRVEKGKLFGGKIFGYDVVKAFDANGEPVTGERTINAEQAAVINRIFKDYANGKGPRQIAKDLNAEGAPSPQGKGWSGYTISGSRHRGSGVINNPLYIGKLVWNKFNYAKDPDTEQRVRRRNPPEDWVTSEVPELRIIPQELWERVKSKQRHLMSAEEASKRRRPKQLLSYLLKCGCCGGGMSTVAQNRYGCTNAHAKGMCDNHTTIMRPKLERIVVDGLQHNLMNPELFAVFCEEYSNHMQALAAQENSHIESAKAKLEKLAGDKASLIKAITEGVRACDVKDALETISKECEKIQTYLDSATETPILPTPDMVERYHQEIVNLRDSLNAEDSRHEAAELMRKLIDKVVLTQDPANKKQFKIDLHGDLAGILSVAGGEKNTEPLTLAFDQQTLPPAAIAQHLTTAIDLTP